MTVEVNQPMSSDRPRYLYVALIASLAVNLLFIGLFATAAWHLHHEHGPPLKGPSFLTFVDKLPEGRREAVKQQVISARAALKDLRESMRQQWLSANAMLSEDPFDKAKFDAALMQLKDTEARYRTGIYNMVADTAGMLTPNERKLLQQWREKRRARFLSKSDDRNKPDDKEDGKPTD